MEPLIYIFHKRLFFATFFSYCLLLSTYVKAKPIQAIDSLKQLLGQEIETELRVDILNKLAAKYMYVDLMEMSSAAKQAIVLSKDSIYPKGYARALKLLGISHWKKGDYLSSFHNYEEALGAYRVIGDSAGVASVFNNMGVLFKRQGDLSRALKYYFEALRLKEGLGEDKKLTTTYGNIGTIYTKLGNHNKALEFYAKAVKIDSAYNDELGLAREFNNIGLTYKAMQQHDLAISHYEKSLALNLKLNQIQLAAFNYSNLAEAYIAKEEYEPAQSYLTKTIEISQQTGYARGEMSGYFGLGEIAATKKAYQEAENYLLKSLTKAEEIGDLEYQSWTYEKLSKISQALGEHEEALSHYQQYKQLQDSLLNDLTAKQVTELQVQYEMEVKDRENERLKYENALKAQKLEGRNKVILLVSLTLLFAFSFVVVLLYSNRNKRRANKGIRIQNEQLVSISNELKTALGHNKKLLGEIHHHTKNHLQIIISLLNLQSRRFKDEAILEQIAKEQNQLRSIALIHQNLLQYDDHNNVAFNQYLTDLIKGYKISLSEAARNIALHLEVSDDAYLEVSKAVPVGLIINEIIPNTFKRSFPNSKAGDIWVTFSQGENGFNRLEIKNNGRNPKMEDQDELDEFVSYGLVKGLVTQLNGDMRISNRAGKFVLIIEFSQEQAQLADSTLSHQ
ncbi:MAG: tetratricopeptide repeat protein [Bacteroidota bacterium]